MNIQFLSSSMDSTTMSNISMIVMLVIMFAVMYFLLYRPQKKQEKKDAEMRNSLEIGDEVTTIGGIVGRVIALKEDTFVLFSVQGGAFLCQNSKKRAAKPGRVPARSL